MLLPSYIAFKQIWILALLQSDTV